MRVRRSVVARPNLDRGCCPSILVLKNASLNISAGTASAPRAPSESFVSNELIAERRAKLAIQLPEGWVGVRSLD